MHADTRNNMAVCLQIVLLDTSGWDEATYIQIICFSHLPTHYNFLPHNKAFIIVSSKLGFCLSAIPQS